MDGQKRDVKTETRESGTATVAPRVESHPRTKEERPSRTPPRRVGRRRARMLSQLVTRVVSIAVFVAAWQVTSMLIPPRYVPGPATTFAKLIEFAGSGALLGNLATTMIRLLGGFAVALLVGVAVGSAMGLYRRAEGALDLWVMVCLTIPSLVYIIIAFLWLGLTELGAIAAIAWTTFPAITVNVWSGVKAIDQGLIDMARVFRASRAVRGFAVILPQILPYVMGASRYGFGIAWKVTVFVELMGRSDGVGYQLNYSFQIFDMPGVFAWTLFFVAIMITIELGILKPLERHLFRWRPELRA
ncbi:MAG: ABC transporter permease subunit [Streptosporangiales bacterium]|nr:ABC transporter permease subunit [Streptosporangiales bacterium]